MIARLASARSRVVCPACTAVLQLRIQDRLCPCRSPLLGKSHFVLSFLGLLICLSSARRPSTEQAAVYVVHDPMTALDALTHRAGSAPYIGIAPRDIRESTGRI